MKNLTACILLTATAAAAVSGCSLLPPTSSAWEVLVDGASGMDNFSSLRSANWAGVDGSIQATEGDKNFAYLLSKSSYSDFTLKAEFWVSDDANSGIFLRCADPEKVDATTCYEVNVFDQRPDASYGTASIVNVAKVVPMPRAGGHWNIFEITAIGPHITVKLNGQQTVDVQDGKLKSGPIALQWGSGTVKFRRLQIQRL